MGLIVDLQIPETYKESQINRAVVISQQVYSLLTNNETANHPSNAITGIAQAKTTE